MHDQTTGGWVVSNFTQRGREGGFCDLNVACLGQCLGLEDFYKQVGVGFLLLEMRQLALT